MGSIADQFSKDKDTINFPKILIPTALIPGSRFAGEGHGAFRATVTVVPGMIQFILSKQCSVFRGVQLEPDRAEIMAQSGAERLVELRLLVGDPIAASVFDENLSGEGASNEWLEPVSDEQYGSL